MVDVIIIGAGPAGCAAAIFLAKNNLKVLIIEKCEFPRYHIGESLLPASYYLFEELGVLSKLKAQQFTIKNHVQFASANRNTTASFYFSNAWPNCSASSTWQVERNQFDFILLEHAKECGASSLMGAEVIDLLQNENGRYEGVQVKLKDNTIKNMFGKVIIDASGQSGVAAVKNHWRVMNQSLKRVAIWQYFKITPSQYHQCSDATTIAYIENKNWFGIFHYAII